MSVVRAYAATRPGGELQPFEFDPGAPASGQVDIRVEYCGICRSDLSMVNDDWGISRYPLVPGHEIVGIVEAAGSGVASPQAGQRVGLGWYSASCMSCEWCASGNHNLCLSARGTIVGRHGGFAERVRADAAWVVPVPGAIGPEVAGPLFCGGITVFNPLVEFGVQAQNRAGVIGIGGLGHLALCFLRALGCEIVAFSTTPEKEPDARAFGAARFVDARDPRALERLADSLDFILSTVDATLDWNAYIRVLRPKGRLHIVGATPQIDALDLSPLVLGQKAISGSPVGSPPMIARMLDFAARRQVRPAVEIFPMAEVNEAMERLRRGKPRYRIVLKADE